jgi:hypothetical protein
MAQQHREEVFRVVVRFRPLNEREKTFSRDQHQLEAADSGEHRERGELREHGGLGASGEHWQQPHGDLLRVFSDTTFSFDDKAFTFDRVFGPDTDQLQLYTESIQPLVKRFIEQPHDVTIIAYGQTSSGKTWTIDGDFYTTEEVGESTAGLLPRAVREILDSTSTPNSDPSPYPPPLIEFSFYEIYCEKIIDLLAGGTAAMAGGNGVAAATGTVQLYDDRKSNKVFMKGLTWRRVTRAADLLNSLKATRAHRHYAFTEMNSNSSRSHTVFDLRVHASSAAASAYKNFRIVDLAGSERASRTKAVGTTFEEGKKINQSLMDLRSIIYQLSRNAGTKNVNHRASKLTRILYGSFRGQSRVVVLTCCSPAIDSLSETLGSLQFACYAKRITLKLDDIKQSVNNDANANTLMLESAAKMREKIATMVAEAEHREKLIQEYEEEMSEMRQVLRKLKEAKEAQRSIRMQCCHDPGQRDPQNSDRHDSSESCEARGGASSENTDGDTDGINNNLRRQRRQFISREIGVQTEALEPIISNSPPSTGTSAASTANANENTNANANANANALPSASTAENLQLQHRHQQYAERGGGSLRNEIGQEQERWSADANQSGQSSQSSEQQQRQQQEQQQRHEQTQSQSQSKHSHTQRSSPPPPPLPPAIPVDYSVTDHHLLLLEKERERNLRYRNTIEMQRNMLRQKMLDNEQLDQELQALRMIKNLILQEF